MTSRSLHKAAASAATLVLLLSALVTAGFVTAGSASATPTGTVMAQPCLKLHKTPKQSAAVVACVPYKTKIAITCTATGQSVSGKYGTSTIWDHTKYSGKAGYLTDTYVYTGTDGRVAGKCAAKTTTPAPAPSSPNRKLGKTASSNTAPVGQCTWWAKEQFKKFTGHYPLISGNAKDYASSAAANGWSVVTKPQVHSIVVFQPGDPNGANRTYGHVAWVTSVSGNKFTVTEMNFKYTTGSSYPRGKSDTRTITYSSDQRFVLAK